MVQDNVCASRTDNRDIAPIHDNRDSAPIHDNRDIVPIQDNRDMASHDCLRLSVDTLAGGVSAFCVPSGNATGCKSFQSLTDISVDAHHMVFASGLPNYLSARLPVPSKLNTDLWRYLLRVYPDNIVCEFLEFGWPVGYTRDTLPVFDLRTHRGASNFPDAVQQYLDREVDLGRVAGPFVSPPFTDGFVSPLNTVEKRDSVERRVIVDLSWPCGSFGE